MIIMLNPTDKPIIKTEESFLFSSVCDDGIVESVIDESLVSIISEWKISVESLESESVESIISVESLGSSEFMYNYKI